MSAFHEWQVDSVLREKLAGRLIKIKMPSRYMRRENTLFVYLPPGYKKSRTRYPVVYLLHGCPGAGRDWFVKARAHRTAEKLILSKKIHPLILVSFDGFGPKGPRDHSEFLNSARGGVQAEDYVVKELPAFIDSHFRTIRKPGARALIGLSSGGYGAVNIGIRHQDVFRVLASHSGYFEPEFEDHYVRLMLGPPGPLWDKNDPMKQIKSWRDDKNLHIYIDCGRSDELYDDNRQFVDELTANGIGHEFIVTNGGHWWRLWRKRLAYSLEYADRRFRAIKNEGS